MGRQSFFANAASGPAFETFPDARTLSNTFAMSFVVEPDASEPGAETAEEQGDGLREEGLSLAERQRTRAARSAVRKIVKLKVDRREFAHQAKALKDTNIVYKDAVYDEALVAKWVPDPSVPQVPAPILESVIAVPCNEDPGEVVASGPADATASGGAEKQDAELEAARQARYISAFEEQARD